jgi:hypothetical protein
MKAWLMKCFKWSNDQMIHLFSDWCSVKTINFQNVMFIRTRANIVVFLKWAEMPSWMMKHQMKRI